MGYSAVIVAAGTGSRMNLGFNKVFLSINNKTILEKTIDVFLSDNNCQEIIVVTDVTMFHKHITNPIYQQCVVVSGGDTRSKSVYCGVKMAKMPYVMIHDGARCNVTLQLLNDLYDAIQINDAVIPLVAVKDTIKIVKDGYVESTPERSILYAAQTPQVFHTAMFKDTLQEAIQNNISYYDDSMVYELLTNRKVKVIPGDYNNIKITTKEDLKFL